MSISSPYNASNVSFNPLDASHLTGAKDLMQSVVQAQLNLQKYSSKTLGQET